MVAAVEEDVWNTQWQGKVYLEQALGDQYCLCQSQLGSVFWCWLDWLLWKMSHGTKPISDLGLPKKEN